MERKNTKSMTEQKFLQHLLYEDGLYEYPGGAVVAATSDETDFSPPFDTADGPAVGRQERTAAAPRPPHPPPGYTGPLLPDADDLLPVYGVKDVPAYGVRDNSPVYGVRDSPAFSVIDSPVYGVRDSPANSIIDSPVYGVGDSPVYGGSKVATKKPTKSPTVKPVQSYRPPLSVTPQATTYTTTRPRPRTTVYYSSTAAPPLVSPASSYSGPNTGN